MSPCSKSGMQRVDQVVDGWAGFDHHHDLARLREVRDQIFDRVAADEFLALRADRR